MKTFRHLFLCLTTASALLTAAGTLSAYEQPQNVEASIQVLLLEPTRFVTLDGPTQRIRPMNLGYVSNEEVKIIPLSGGRSTEAIEYRGPATLDLWEFPDIVQVSSYSDADNNGFAGAKRLGQLNLQQGSGRYLLIVLPDLPLFRNGSRLTLIPIDEHEENSLLVRNISPAPIAVNLDSKIVPLAPWSADTITMESVGGANRSVQVAVNLTDTWRIASSSIMTFPRSSPGVLLVYPQESNMNRWNVRRVALWRN